MGGVSLSAARDDAMTAPALLVGILLVVWCATPLIVGRLVRALSARIRPPP